MSKWEVSNSDSGLNGKRYEKKLPNILRPVSRSGAGQTKGDYHTEDFVIELKTTNNKSYTLPLEVLQSIAQFAQEANKTPALFISFLDGTNPKHNGDWVCIPRYVFMELFDNS